SYNADKTEAYVTVPVLALPQQSAAVALTLSGGISRPKGTGITEYDSSKAVTVPGQNVFVSLAEADNTIVTDDELDKKQVLFLSFTRKVKTVEAQKVVRAFLLPYSRAGEDLKNKRRTNWSNIPWEQITKEDLGRGTPVTLKPMPVPEEYSNALPFSYGAEGKRFLYVTGHGIVPSESDYNLAEFTFVSQVPEIVPELRIMQDGTILSMAGAKKLAIMSRGLDEIGVQVSRVRPEFLNLLVTQPHSNGGLAGTDLDGDYDDYISFADVSERFNHFYKTKISSEYQVDYSAIDLSQFLKNGGKGIFCLELSGYKNASKRVVDRRFLLLTDLGLTLKKSSTGSSEVFVSSFAGGGPVTGATVQVMGRNGLPIFSKHTDSRGQVSLPELSGFNREKEPVAIKVEQDGDLAYLPFNDSSRVVSLSRFPETAGRNVDENGVSIFTFSERGIYRPGENLRFGLVAKPGNWKAAEMAGLPIKAILLDSRNNTVFERKLRLDAEGMFDLDIPMEESYPTGRYNLDVYLSDNLVGSANVQVEEFQPDNLKVSTSIKGVPITGVKGWLLPAGLEALVQVENLYGAPAIGNRVEAFVALEPTRLAFSKYRKFTFYDPGDSGSSFNSSLSKEETNELGEVSFKLPSEQFAGGTYWLNFGAEAFESGGGRSVSGATRVLVSPHDKLVGWTSEAKLNFLASNSEAKVSFIAVDPDLEPVSLGDLKLNISEVTYVASLIKDNNGRYRYDKVRNLSKVRELDVGVDAAQGLELSLPTEKSGEFVLSLVDGKGLERCNLSYVVAGGSQRRFGLERDATLRIHLDKNEYQAGDEISIFISAPYAGSGLITLESDKVYGSKWFKADTSDSVQSISVPESFEGRAFVSVSMVRAIDSDAVHSTPYTYAVAPFIANIARRNMNLKVETPDKVKPGDILNIKVSADKPGKAIVWAVSEGILQLTRYKTPSLLDYFLRQNPLMVSTLQNLDLIMPEFYLMNRSAFGGDFDAKMALGALGNPFKRKSEPSVVYWSGLVEVSSAGTNLAWEVPAYFNGALRVMAISSSDSTIGESQCQTIVRGPLIITPDLPVAVAPGDEFEVTAAIANNIENSGAAVKIDVAVELDEHLSFVRKPPESITVDEGREGKAVFRLKANAVLGASDVRITAGVAAPGDSDGSILVRRPVSLSVRPASPHMSSFKAGFVKAAEQVVPTGRNLYAEFANVQASVSGLPLPLVDALSSFLLAYPHGCTEQILSRAFPYAILHEAPELLPLPRGETPAIARQKAVAAVNKGIMALRERQVAPGRFALWPMERYAYPFLTVYGFDFLLSAREAGFEVPNELFESTRREVAVLLQELPDGRSSAQTICYAVWVYIRSGQRFTGLPQLVKHMDTAVKGWRQTTCGALIAGSYKMLKQNAEADALIKEVRMVPAKPDKDNWEYSNWFFSRLWDNGLQLNVIARNFPELLDSVEVRNLLVTTVNDIVGGSYTTTSSTQAIRGLVGYALSNVANRPELKLVARDTQHKDLPVQATGTAVQRLDSGAEAAEFMFSGGTGLYWQISAQGYDKEPPVAEAKKINIQAEYIPSGEKDLTALAQGDEVYVLLTASATENMDNVAISSLLPGGFEMVISKGGVIVGGGAGSRSSAAEEDEDFDGEDEVDESWDTGETRAYPNEAHRRDVVDMLKEAGLSGVPMNLVHVERREDRMVVFTSLDKKSRLFIYRIKAINKGSYTLPTVYAEAMYDPDARAHTNPGKLEIK
ncbi:MAG: hypothetical protein LBV76_02170, partial [Deltaproteobacteria bacterium]|nr:hypothetical protein [Deltaproteobacteria bacterium]